jgi:uncharacterized cupredoxin-like copper-binding protein
MLYVLLLAFMLSLQQAALAADTVSFAAFDYGFSGPDSVPSGMTTVEIVNKGHELHHVQLIRLLEGKTAQSFEEALKADPLSFPKWALLAGGPNAVIPGEQATAIIKLEPGNYLVICLIPDKQNIPHVALGMAKPFQVVGNPQDTELPSGSLRIGEVDFTFSIPATIAPGYHMIRVRNNGAEPHEVVLVQLPLAVSIADFARAAVNPGSAPPPGKPVGGMTGLQPGSEAAFAADLVPGKYGLICFFPDERGAPHFTRGMMTEFTVTSKQ